MRDPTPDAIDRAIAELTRRKCQHEVAADAAAARSPSDHRRTAADYARVIDLLRECRDAERPTPETGVRINTDEVVITEVTPSGHRRRRYRASDAAGIDATLSVERWAVDGWVPVGSEAPVEQLVINGRRAFE